jgi:hypothetical protein
MKLSDISLKNNVKYNDSLNPKIWDENNKLRTEIRTKLIEIAEKFVEFLEIDESAVEDYYLVGSIANYNWNKYSDIDLHVLMDYNKVAATCNGEIVEEFLFAKRAVWLDRFDIEIEGLDVEIGPQSTETELTSEAVYSILENKWIKKPVKKEPEIDTAKYDAKLKEVLKKIETVLASNPDSKQLDALSEFIKEMRHDSLNLTKGGTEFSINNLVFKTLRNQGYIDKIKDLRDKKTSEELSL